MEIFILNSIGIPVIMDIYFIIEPETFLRALLYLFRYVMPELFLEKMGANMTEIHHY